MRPRVPADRPVVVKGVGKLRQLTAGREASLRLEEKMLEREAGHGRPEKGRD